MKERIREAYDEVKMTDAQKARALSGIYAQAQRKWSAGWKIALAAGLAAVVVAAAVVLPLTLGGDISAPDQVAVADTMQTPIQTDAQAAANTQSPAKDSAITDAPDKGEASISPDGEGELPIPDNWDIRESINFTGRWQMASWIESGKTEMVCIVSESGEDDIDDDDYYVGLAHLEPYQNNARYIIVERADASHPTSYEVYEIIPDIVYTMAGQDTGILDTDSGDVRYIEQDGIVIGMYTDAFRLLYKQTLSNGNVQFYATDITGGDVEYKWLYDTGHYDQPFQRIIEYERADVDKTFVCMTDSADESMDEETPNIGEVKLSGIVNEFMQNGEAGEYLWVGMDIYTNIKLVDDADFVYNGKSISEWADEVHIKWDYYARFGDFKKDDTEAYLEAFNKGEDAIDQAYREYWISLHSDQNVIDETLHSVDNLKAARVAYDSYRQGRFNEIAFAECVRLREAGYDVSYQPPEDPRAFKGIMKGALIAEQIRDFPAGACGYILYAYGMNEAMDA